MLKKEFVCTVLAKVKQEAENMHPDDWRGLLQNWIKC